MTCVPSHQWQARQTAHPHRGTTDAQGCRCRGGRTAAQRAERWISPVPRPHAAGAGEGAGGGRRCARARDGGARERGSASMADGVGDIARLAPAPRLYHVHMRGAQEWAARWGTARWGRGVMRRGGGRTSGRQNATARGGGRRPRGDDGGTRGRGDWWGARRGGGRTRALADARADGKRRRRGRAPSASTPASLDSPAWGGTAGALGCRTRLGRRMDVRHRM
ncbi:hypothetical protein C8J57DRAFT_343107 [Mycena rebaudengoi]|nr:hypothetical protein C8J57DRAFT_343107 [Mycena rebaudengoi]